MAGLNGDGRIGFGNKPIWMLCEVDERIGRKGNGIAMAKTKLGPQTPAERKIVEADVKQLIDKLASSHSKLIASIRRRLRERLPTAFELVYGYRDWIVISFSPSTRGYEGVLAIHASEEGVKLYFNRGRELADPNRLLKGSGKQARWIQVESLATLKRDVVEELIEQAIALNDVPFPTKQTGSLIIQSTTSK